MDQMIVCLVHGSLAGVRTMSHGAKKIYEMKKPHLPAKLCKVCGDMIARTRRVAREWERIQYCSAVCRRMATAQERIAAAS
jgi:hypothetical protein